MHSRSLISAWLVVSGFGLIVPTCAQEPGKYSWTGSCIATGCPTRNGVCPDAPALGCEIRVGDSLLAATVDAKGGFTTPTIAAYQGNGVKLRITASGCLPRVFYATAEKPGLNPVGRIVLERGYQNRKTVSWSGMTQTLVSQWPEYLPGDTVRAAVLIGNPNGEPLSYWHGDEECSGTYWMGSADADTIYRTLPRPCRLGFGVVMIPPGMVEAIQLPPFRIPPGDRAVGWILHERRGMWGVQVGKVEQKIEPTPWLDLPLGRQGFSRARGERKGRTTPLRQSRISGQRPDGRRF